MKKRMILILTCLTLFLFTGCSESTTQSVEKAPPSAADTVTTAPHQEPSAPSDGQAFANEQTDAAEKDLLQPIKPEVTPVESGSEPEPAPEPAPKQETSPSVTVPTPDSASDRLVWIPVNGGKKYHSHADCSNMIAPIQDTVESALAQGFTACKRCH